MLLLIIIYLKFISRTIALVKSNLIFLTVVITFFNNLSNAQSEFINPERRVFKSLLTYSNENRYLKETMDQLNRYDVKFYKLDLSVSKYSTEIQGTGLVYAIVQNAPIDTFVIELIDTLAEETYMFVDSVIVSGQIRSFIHKDHLIKVPLDPPLPVNSYFTAVIYYYGNGNPCAAASYNGISNGEVFNSRVTYTYSEPFWSSVWWPCKQYLNDKADSIQISITTESDCKAGSNGLLKSIVQLPGGKVRYEWKSNYPIDYYLVSFAVGDYFEDLTYAPIEETNDSILIQSYLFQNSPSLQINFRAIEKTKDLLQLYTKLYGDYPFKNEKYGYCLTNNQWGAMEHQTMTTTGYLSLDTTANLIMGIYLFWYSAHELGHSWFGDNVTCAAWQDIWINEGFATYSEYLALQNLESQTRANYMMSHAHSNIKSLPGGSVYVPDEFKNDESRIFDVRLSYNKGSAIVHMIRYETGNDSLFFLALRNFQDTYKANVATGLDFKEVLESTTGKDFTDFFNQWYFGEGFPIYNVHWMQTNDTLKIRSVQTTSSVVTPLFNIPVEFKIFYAGGDTTIIIHHNTNEELIEMHLIPSVNSITVDPDNWIINSSNIIHTGTDNDNTIRSFHLYQNYPNPFNPATKITYSTPEYSRIIIKVFDILGNEIATLLDEEKSAGIYELSYTANELPSGIYFYRLQAMPVDAKAASFMQSKKMILMK